MPRGVRRPRWVPAADGPVVPRCGEGRVNRYGKKWPVSPRGQAKTSPARHGPGGLVCAPRGMFLAIVPRRPSHLKWTSVQTVSLIWPGEEPSYVVESQQAN